MKHVEAFVNYGKNGMKLWRNVMDGCKFLVVRRDGTLPEWPHFVMGARDPWAPAAMMAYADAAAQDGADPEYVESIRAEAMRFEEYRRKNGAGDPEAAPHRVDDPSIVQIMRDSLGGRIFIAAAWDKDQYEREMEKQKSDEGPIGGSSGGPPPAHGGPWI